MSHDAPVCTYILVTTIKIWVSGPHDPAQIAAIGSHMRYAQQEKQQLEEAIFVQASLADGSSVKFLLLRS